MTKAEVIKYLKLIKSTVYLGNRKFITALDEAIEFLSEPERKTGRWINRSLNILYPEWERYTCSECGKHSYLYDFCPNCGSYNGGGA